MVLGFKVIDLGFGFRVGGFRVWGFGFGVLRLWTQGVCLCAVRHRFVFVACKASTCCGRGIPLEDLGDLGGL